MVDNSIALMALDRQAQGALAPYVTDLDLSQSRGPMLALLGRVQQNMPWAPQNLVSTASQIFDLGAFPRLRAYAPGTGALPAWLLNTDNYNAWRKMITTLFKPVDQAFLKSNMALLAAEGNAAANDVAFWNTVYNVADTVNQASPIRIGQNLAQGAKDFKDALDKSWKPAAIAAGAVAVVGLGIYGYLKLRKRK